MSDLKHTVLDTNSAKTQSGVTTQTSCETFPVIGLLYVEMLDVLA